MKVERRQSENSYPFPCLKISGDGTIALFKTRGFGTILKVGISTTLTQGEYVKSVTKHESFEELRFQAVCKSGGYPEDGSDENNSYAKWTPSATLDMCITNPNLLGKFAVGEEFYVDFTPVNAF